MVILGDALVDHPQHLFGISDDVVVGTHVFVDLGPVDVDDGVDDVLVIVLFIVNLVVGVEQLVNDVGVFRRQGLADLGTGVLGGGQAAHLDEPVEGDAVPFAHVVDLVPQLFQLLRRIVDEGGKLVPVRPGNGGLKQFVDLLPHHAGGGV